MNKRTGILLASGAALVGVAGLALVAARFRPRRDPLPPGTVADYVLIEKKAHRLTVFSAHQKLRSYKIALGRGGLGLKRSGWDGKTPEGLYRIDAHQADKDYPHALRLNYPSEKDQAMAQRRHRSPSGHVLIHGIRYGFGWLGIAQRFMDWTGGSIALTNPEMAELYYIIPDGASVEIRK